jgi:hypothetical protein
VPMRVVILYVKAYIVSVSDRVTDVVMSSM